MGMTMAEKVLARASARQRVSPGDFVTAHVDLVMSNDAQFPGSYQALADIGLASVVQWGLSLSGGRDSNGV
jgi:homoaconitase/3-isopropylmalate dehydratase large subunit